MALANLIGLILLAGLIVRETLEFLSQRNWKELVEVDKRPPGQEPPAEP